jgi:hypothetical protein
MNRRYGDYQNEKEKIFLDRNSATRAGARQMDRMKQRRNFLNCSGAQNVVGIQ